MTALLAHGRVLDFILAAMACEGVALTMLWRGAGRGVAPSALLWNLGSGMCLLAAMRLALAGAWWGLVSAALLGALALHVADLRRQWVLR